jgi:hypothetical protein
LNNDSTINKNIDIKGTKNNTNNIVINNNMIIKVQNNQNNSINKNKKIKKIETDNKANNFNYSNGSITNDNSFNFKKTINEKNNSLYNYQIGNKKSLSQGKDINLIEYQNLSVTNKSPNLMTISLPPEKISKISKISKINDRNNNISSTIDNISSTFYTFKNINKNNGNKKMSVYNNSFYQDLTKKKYPNKIIKSNMVPVLSNNYLGGYKTFFNKNKTNNDKYNYNINTKYFEEEMKKYNHSPDVYYNNNIIDENEEYNSNYSNGINAKSFYNKNNSIYPNKKNSLEGKKLNNKIFTKYKNNIYSNKTNGHIKYNYSNKKLNNAYGTIYNYGGGFFEKKNNIELPQLIKLYNNNKHTTYRNNNKSNISYGYSLRNSKYY